jgi:hypothetical protein
MTKAPKPRGRAVTAHQVRQALDATRRQLGKVVEPRRAQTSGDGRAAQGRRQSPVVWPLTYTAAPAKPYDPADVFRSPDATFWPQQRFAVTAQWGPYKPAVRLPDAPPPRRSAKIVRVQEASPQYAIGLYGSVTPRTYRMPGDPPPRFVYRPEAAPSKPYDEDMSDSDFVTMARKSKFYTPRSGDRNVIGVGAAQGRIIPLALARQLGGYIDPDTGKTMRFAGNYTQANAVLDRQGSMMMTRRRDAMNTAAIERAIQSPSEQRFFATTRGAGDGVIEGVSPVVEASLQALSRGTPWRDNHAAAKYQTRMDETEHPYFRNGGKLAAAVLVPSPLGKAKAGGMLAKVGKDAAWSAFTGTAGGALTTEGDLGDRLEGGLKGGLLNVGMDRLADGAVGVVGRRLDALAPAAWRKVTGFDMPSTKLIRRALHNDNSTLNGLPMRATDEVPSAPGPYLAGLKEALDDTNKARQGGLKVIPSATQEGQSFRSEVASLDPYSTQRLDAVLSGEPDLIDQMIVGHYFEGLRRRSGEPVKRVVAAAGQIPLDDDAGSAPDPMLPRLALPRLWVERTPIDDPLADPKRDPPLYYYRGLDGSYFVDR